MKNNIRLFCGLLTAVIAGGAAFNSSAAEVRVGLSTRETYVGLPVTLRIQVANATKAEPPTVPSIDGLEIKSLGTPSRSTQITTINGRTTTSTTQTFAFELTPQRVGTFRIPAITVNVDGAAQETRAIEFVASKSDTDDLLFVEITGKEKQIYVGQALDLTLKMWLRPFSDRRLKTTLSDGNMWRMISDRTEWGPFAEQIQQLARNDQRPVGKETLRKDKNGVEHSYYLYQLDTTIYPKRPGTINADNVKIVVDYPTALGRSRGPFANLLDDFPGGGSGVFGDDDGFSPFGSQLAVKSVRPLVAQAIVEPIDVMPIPTAGRPTDYRGAVGRYQIAVDASPSHVKAGDPINLLIGISGTGPMELVQAPPLSELPELTADFKVPNEPLAGFVKGERKVFSTSIRPRKSGITQIPAIPFSYFDPAAGKFVTVRSAPISIQVDPAEILALDTVISGGQAANPNSNVKQPAETVAAATSLAIFTGDDLLKDEAPFLLNWRLVWTLLAVPPLVVFAIFLLRARTGLSLLAGRFRSMGVRLRRAVEQAQDPVEIANVVTVFASQQCNLKGKAIDPAIVVGAIRASGRRNLAIRCERLLNACTGGFDASMLLGDNSIDKLKLDALQWLNDWQAESGRPTKPGPRNSKLARSRGKTSSLRSSASTVVVAIALAGSLLVTGNVASAQATESIGSGIAADAISMKLNGQQQKMLLDEATNSYKSALEKVKNDSAEAKQGFADAADKYQLLVNDGVTNSRVYFNLANAYLETGQTGKAIANYLRCLRIDPTMRKAQTNLAYAQECARSHSDKVTAKSQGQSLSTYESTGNRWLNCYLSPRAIFVIMVVAWFALWTSIGFRVAGFKFRWKVKACAALLLFILAASSSVLDWQSSAHHLAVVIQPANSKSPEVANAETGAGQVVEILQQRTDSTRIRTENNESAWLPTAIVEAI